MHGYLNCVRLKCELKVQAFGATYPISAEFCPGCGEPTTSLEVLKAPTIYCFHCGGDIVKGPTGEYPTLCLDCGEPRILQQCAEVLNCPECGEKRVRSPKTKRLGNACGHCGYNYSKGQAPTAIDVVVAFEDMKNKIDEVKRALQGNSIHKKIMSPADEDYIHLISKMARKRLADYQGHLQSKKNRYNTTASAGLIASRNVLRNFFNNNAQKLNPILMKCGVTEFCPECGEPTTSLEVLKAPTIYCLHCGGDIVKGPTGEYPTLCLDCGEPRILQQCAEVLNCPECGEKRVRSPKTKRLGNACGHCGYNYSKGQASTAIDVVVAFEDMKNKIEEVKRALQGNSIHKDHEPS
ncbi:hypothetical protein EB796_020448 [Bugula neritina]|uniref:Uncharacterized protein n=1 Tax=Bugula neritina TaxID=10212 RepID=A0A7J7J5U3_BUGNE|nr:hypothetical protein EB796_020448 [Bugula neritina]